MKYIAVLVALMSAFQATYAQYGDYSVRVEVEGNSYAHFTIVYFDDESWDPLNPPSYGWDACCDALMNMGNVWQPHVFTQVVAPPASPNNHRISINGLPHVFEHTEVPLGFLPGELAEFTFTIEELYTLPVGMTVELEDHALSVTQDMLADSTYTTWSAVSDDEERFTLHFYPANVTSSNNISDEEVQLSAWSDSERIVIGRPEEGIRQVKLYNMLGSEVWDGKFDSSGNELIIDRKNLPSGIYIFQLITEKAKRLTLKICI